MRVVLRRVTKTPLDFEVKSGAITFKGFLEYHNAKLILLDAVLSGTLTLDCDTCAEEFTLAVDEKIKFFISDGMFEDEGDIEFDVVESFDGDADIEEILHSEIELIRSDYHICSNCEKN